MGVLQHLEGRRFGRLVAISPAQTIKGFHGWRCRCDCGGQSIVPTAALNSGNTKSCGCHKRNVLGESTTKHGLHGTELYVIWKGMRGRCLNPAHKQYAHYGGRGIKIHPRWDDFAQYRTYILRYLGPRPAPSYSLDRINNAGDYAPGNIRWATQREQNNNNRRVKRIRWKGKTKTLCDWSEILGVRRATLYARLFKYGWSVERAFGSC